MRQDERWAKSTYVYSCDVVTVTDDKVARIDIGDQRQAEDEAPLLYAALQWGSFKLPVSVKQKMK